MGTHNETFTESDHKIARLCRDALFHAIRGVNHINNEMQRMPRAIETTDSMYHLEAAVGFLRQIRETTGQ